MAVDYPYIRAWGQLLGSGQYYIDQEVELARKEGAPADAIYHNREDSYWARFADIADSNPNKATVARLVESMQ